MKTQKILYIAAGLIMLGFVACKKDKSTSLTAQEKLLVKNWTIDSLTMKSMVHPQEDSSILKNCVKQSKVLFNSSKQFQIVDVAKNCDSLALPYGKGTWSLATNGGQLVLDGSRDLKWQILSLTNEKIKATFRDSLSPQHNFVKTIVLKQ